MNLRAMGRYPAVSSRLDALAREEQRMMQMARQDATRSQQANTLPPVDDTFTKSSTGRAHRLPSTDHPQRTRMDVALGGDLPPEPTFAEMPLSPGDLSGIVRAVRTVKDRDPLDIARQFVQGERGTVEVGSNIPWDGVHGTFKESLPTTLPKRFGGLHAGTPDAARQRVESTRPSQRQGRPGGQRFFPVRAASRKSYGTPDNPVDETEMALLTTSPDKLKKLAQNGFDVVFYRNSVEDRGSVSALILDLTRIQ